MRAVTALALLTLAVLAPMDLRPGRDPADHRPNVVVILTDDQTLESLHHQPSPMPWLTGRLADPQDHWLEFTNAFVNTPLCCPSRSTLLTGRYSHHTGVRDNHSGQLLDESQTIATWLHDAGYWTGLFGKYLNGNALIAPRGHELLESAPRRIELHVFRPVLAANPRPKGVVAVERHHLIRPARDGVNAARDRVRIGFAAKSDRSHVVL